MVNYSAFYRPLVTLLPTYAITGVNVYPTDDLICHATGRGDTMGANHCGSA